MIVGQAGSMKIMIIYVEGNTAGLIINKSMRAEFY